MDHGGGGEEEGTVKQMKLTKSQQKELVVWRYFIPTCCHWKGETEEDLKKFFEWSEKGKHKESHYGDLSYFNALREGKSWAGVNMQMWEDGVLDGTMPYFTILGGLENDKKWWQFWKSPHKPIPREIVDFMKKELFKGVDAEIIEDCYQSLL